MTLANAKVGACVRIVHAKLDVEVASWLAAVGLAVGDELVLLRRAAFGGPLHVRTASGGEFAVGREVAAHLEIADVAPV